LVNFNHHSGQDNHNHNQWTSITETPDSINN